MKRYMNPELDVILFSERDVIATSTPIGEGDDDFAIGDENKDF